MNTCICGKVALRKYCSVNCKERNYRKNLYKNFVPPNTSYDESLLFRYSEQTSEYYAIMVEKLGKQMADYYWKRRHAYEGDRDLVINWTRLCKEITEKCDLFLKSRGINNVGY